MDKHATCSIIQTLYEVIGVNYPSKNFLELGKIYVSKVHRKLRYPVTRFRISR